MAELKTKKNKASVDTFIESISNETAKEDCKTLLRLMEKCTGEKASMWGDSIVGFGNYHYKYASGRKGDWFEIGFSPRKHSLTIYTMCGLDKNTYLLSQLGKHKIGKACLYVKSLSDIDMQVLEKILLDNVNDLRANRMSER